MTHRTMRCAVVQLTSTEDVEANLRDALFYIEAAARAGAQLVATPETTAFVRSDSTESVHQSIDGDIVSAMREVALDLGIHVLLGSFHETSDSSADKCHNTSVLIDDNGEILATYRKLHLFDIDIPGRETQKESDRFVAGNHVVVGQSEFGPLGMSICYDLRFPELYRELTRLGSRIIFVPAAFTQYTGKDHWLPLLRARAIENQVFIVAPGQYGHHGGKRVSYGHSVIIDPWGIVLAQAADKPGYAIADLDFRHQKSIREQLPCLSHQHVLFRRD